MQNKALCLALVAVFLTACGPKPSAEPAAPVATQAAAPAPAPAASEPSASTLFSVTPSTMSDCEPVVAKLTWDVRTQHPNVAEVEIYVGDDGSSKLFAAAGASGELETGAWSKSGATYRLLNKATGDELARASVSGPDCSQQ